MIVDDDADPRDGNRCPESKGDENAMVHPMVEQLKFARSEFERSLKGVTVEEAVQRFLPMNCLSWIVGHLADQEQRYWLTLQGSEPVAPGLNALVGHGKPASTPPLVEMWSAWRAVHEAADPFLSGLTGEDLLRLPKSKGRTMNESIGTRMSRVLYHYWFHIGEGQAIRQLQGAADLEDFVGDIGLKAPYRQAD